MSNLNGSAYASSGEIYSMALGNNILKGAAKGNDIFWLEGSVLYDIVSVSPNPAVKDTTITAVVSCNRQTNYVVTYNSNGTGITRTVTNIEDMEDGTRQITFTFTMGSAGNRIINVYGATQQGSAVQHRSVGYLPMSITITN